MFDNKLKIKLMTAYDGIAINGHKPAKLWLYCVAFACASMLDIVSDKEKQKTPLISLFSEVNKMNIESVIDAANEVYAFDINKVNEMIYHIWCKRQSCVFPKMNALLEDKDYDAVNGFVGSFMGDNFVGSEVLTSKEMTAVIIAATAIRDIKTEG